MGGLFGSIAKPELSKLKTTKQEKVLVTNENNRKKKAMDDNMTTLRCHITRAHKPTSRWKQQHNPLSIRGQKHIETKKIETFYPVNFFKRGRLV